MTPDTKFPLTVTPAALVQEGMRIFMPKVPEPVTVRVEEDVIGNVVVCWIETPLAAQVTERSDLDSESFIIVLERYLE